MKTTTIVILAVVIICLVLVGVNRYHHRQHHFNTDDLRQVVKNILSLQPDHIMRRSDFLKALRDHYNRPEQGGIVAPWTSKGEGIREI